MKEDLKKVLDSGNVLATLLKNFVNDPKDETLYPLLNCLIDSDLWVPMTLEMSKEDEELLKNSKKGDEVKTKEDIKMRPDILKSGEELFFPIFSQMEQIPEEYKNEFSWAKMPLINCISLCKATENVEAIVLDAFTSKFEIHSELMGYLEEGIEAKSKNVQS